MQNAVLPALIPGYHTYIYHVVPWPLAVSYLFSGISDLSPLGSGLADDIQMADEPTCVT